MEGRRMANWMRRMAIVEAANSTLVLPPPNPSMSNSMPLLPHKTANVVIPLFSRTATTPYLISVLTPRHRAFLSAPAPSCLPAHHNSSDLFDAADGDCVAIPSNGSKVLLKGMTYTELQKWVQSHGYRPGQAMMLWKRMYGNNIWAHHTDELQGLNKDFKKMLSENAEFKVLSLKEIRTAADGTKKDIADFVHIG